MKKIIGKLSQNHRARDESCSAALGIRSMLTRSFVCLIVCVMSLSAAAQDQPIYMRYQGTIDQVSGDLPNVIDCSFTLSDSNGERQWAEQHDAYVIERHFTVALGTETPLTANLFSIPLSLQVRCDIDEDGAPDIEVTEVVGETPRAAVALSAKGPINADYLEINNLAVIDSSGQWIGPTLSNLSAPEENHHLTNKLYVDMRISSLRLENTTLQGNISTLTMTTTTLGEQLNAQQATLDTLSAEQTGFRQDLNELEDEITGLESVREDFSAELAQGILESEERSAVTYRALDPSYPRHFTYRSRLFETYDVASGTYLFDDQAALFGGVTPQAWSSGATADQVELDLLSGFLINNGQGGANALISSSQFTHTSDQQGAFLIIHFQVENTDEVAKAWPLNFEYSCYEGRPGGPQRSSLALNGVLEWSSVDSNCTALTHSAQVTLQLPPQETSDIVMVIAGSAPASPAIDPGTPAPVQHRRVMFAFTGECLTLPEGLRYRKAWH